MSRGKWLRLPSAPGLAGLVQQLPDAWTSAQRTLFIDAFLKVLDFTVAIIPDTTRPSAEAQQ